MVTLDFSTEFFLVSLMLLFAAMASQVYKDFARDSVDLNHVIYIGEQVGGATGILEAFKSCVLTFADKIRHAQRKPTRRRSSLDDLSDDDAGTSNETHSNTNSFSSFSEDTKFTPDRHNNHGTTHRHHRHQTHRRSSETDATHKEKEKSEDGGGLFALTDADIELCCRDILVLCNRTQSGGDTYFCVEAMLAKCGLQTTAASASGTDDSFRYANLSPLECESDPLHIMVDIVDGASDVEQRDRDRFQDSIRMFIDKHALTRKIQAQQALLYGPVPGVGVGVGTGLMTQNQSSGGNSPSVSMRLTHSQSNNSSVHTIGSHGTQQGLQQGQHAGSGTGSDTEHSLSRTFSKFVHRRTEDANTTVSQLLSTFSTQSAASATGHGMHTHSHHSSVQQQHHQQQQSSHYLGSLNNSSHDAHPAEAGTSSTSSSNNPAFALNLNAVNAHKQAQRDRRHNQQHQQSRETMPIDMLMAPSPRDISLLHQQQQQQQQLSHGSQVNANYDEYIKRNSMRLSAENQKQLNEALQAHEAEQLQKQQKEDEEEQEIGKHKFIHRDSYGSLTSGGSVSVPSTPATPHTHVTPPHQQVQHPHLTSVSRLQVNTHNTHGNTSRSAHASDSSSDYTSVTESDTDINEIERQTAAAARRKTLEERSERRRSVNYRSPMAMRSSTGTPSPVPGMMGRSISVGMASAGGHGGSSMARRNSVSGPPPSAEVCLLALSHFYQN